MVLIIVFLRVCAKVQVEELFHSLHLFRACAVKLNGSGAGGILCLFSYGNLQYTTLVLSRCNGRLAASLNSLYSRFSKRIFALAAVASLAASSVPRASIAI